MSEKTTIKDMGADEVQACIEAHWQHATYYLAEILAGTYSVEDARADLQSLIDMEKTRAGVRP